MQTKPDHDLAKVKGDCDGLIQQLHQGKGWHEVGINSLLVNLESLE